MAPPPSPSPSSPSGAGGSTPNAPSSSMTSTTPKPSPASSQRASSPTATTTTTNANTTSPLQLYIAIRRGRVVLLTTVTVLFLLLMVFTFRHGIELTTITDTEKTPEQQTKLLDDYNSYSGNIASLFGTPVEKFVEAAVQVILLRFLTRAIMAAEPTWKLNVAAGGVGMLAAYLISNGFTALNVQLRPRGLDAVISAEDLSVAFNQSLPGLSTNTTHSFPETQPRNPITNTILRNVVLPRVLNQQPWCEFVSKSSIPNLDVTFGFVRRDWQTRVFQEALPVQQIRTSITDASNMTLLDGATSADMPMNASLAADLYLFGMLSISRAFSMQPNFLNETEITQRYPLTSQDSRTAPSILREDAANNETLAQVVGLLPPDSARATGETAKRGHFLTSGLSGLRSHFKAAGNFSTAQINMTLSHVQISDSVAFDAITFEFEIDPMLLADVATKDNATRYAEIDTQTSCGPLPGQCLMTKVPYGSNGSQYDPPAQVQALGRCVNAEGSEEVRASFWGVYPNVLECARSSNTSTLVFSVGKRITAERLATNDKTLPEWKNLTSGAYIATNLRKIYTVTLGRLSWQWRNLSSDFGASCDDRDSVSACLGLQLPLAKTAVEATPQVLVVGANSLSVSTLLPLQYPQSAMRMLPLALVFEPSRTFGPDVRNPDVYAAGNMLLPHNIQLRNRTDLSHVGASSSCEATVEARINSTLNNHLYNEHGLQPAYTAAVFFLFENAVVRDVIPLNSTATTLDFAHNVRHLSVWLSVPDQSVWFTLAGCILLVFGLTAAMLETATLSKSKSDSLANITAPHVIARVMLDEGQFPPLLLHRHVVGSDDAKGGEMTHRRVEQFAIDSLGLKNQENQDRLVAVV